MHASKTELDLIHSREAGADLLMAAKKFSMFMATTNMDPNHPAIVAFRTAIASAALVFFDGMKGHP